MVLKLGLLVVGLIAGGMGPSAASESPQSPTDKEVIDNPIAKGAPNYPSAAVDALVEGVVTLEVVIGLDGSVAKARVLKEDPPNWGFGAAALAAVKKWKYKPAGREVTFTLDMAFELPPDFKEKMRRQQAR